MSRRAGSKKRGSRGNRPPERKEQAPERKEQAPERKEQAPERKEQAKGPAKVGDVPRPTDAPPAQRPLSRRALLLALLGCWALAFAAYGTSLEGTFLFDDARHLVRTDCHTKLDNIPSMFNLGSGSICAHRPLRSASFAIDHAIWGRDPFGYHLTNVLLHGLVSLLFGLTILQLGGRRRLAAIATLLFALHPIGTEAVAYISGRRDLLAALFALLATRLYLGYADRGGLARAVGAPLCFAAAVLSHELAAALPAALVLIDLARTYRAEPATSLGQALRGLLDRRAAPLAVMAAVVVAYGAWKVFGTSSSHRDELWGPNLGAHVGTVMRVHAIYLKQLLLPVKLIVDYSHETIPVSTSLFEPAALGATALVLGLIALCVWRFRQAPLSCAAGLSYFILLLPVSQIIIHHELAAEHRLYLPATCFCGLLAVALDGAITRWGQPLWGLGGALLLAYLVLTNQRNADYRNPETLWSKTVAQAPRNARALGNLGAQYLNRGRIEEARGLLERAVTIQPKLCAASVNYGEALVRLGEVERGLAIIKNGRKCLVPGRYEYRLGRALSGVGRWREAAEMLRQAIARGEQRAEYHRLLAYALHRLKDRRAIEEYRRALALRPNFVPALFGLGVVLAETCQEDKARQVLTAVQQRVGPKAKLARGAARILEAMQVSCLQHRGR